MSVNECFLKKRIIFLIVSFYIVKNSLGIFPRLIIFDFNNLNFDSYVICMEKYIKNFDLQNFFFKNRFAVLLISYFSVAFYLNSLVKNIFKEKFFDFFLFDNDEIESILYNSKLCFGDYVQLLSLSKKIANIYYYNKFMIFFCFIPVFCQELKFLVYNKEKIMNSIVIMKKKLF